MNQNKESRQKRCRCLKIYFIISIAVMQITTLFEKEREMKDVFVDSVAKGWSGLLLISSFD
jgi:hypothetical protein